MMVITMQMLSGLTGLMAAVLWFFSASSKATTMTFEGLGQLQEFLEKTNRMNRWAAGFTAASMGLASVATWIVAVGPH